MQKVYDLCYEIEIHYRSTTGCSCEPLEIVKSRLTSEIPVQLQDGHFQQEVPNEAGEQLISDVVADSESLVEGHLGTSVQLEDLQLPDDDSNVDGDSSGLSHSPIPSTSRGPDLPQLNQNLGSRCSSPRKPKIHADYLYYQIWLVLCS